MQELKQKLEPELIEQIKTQRLAAMETGRRFLKFRRDGAIEKGKEAYCKLDSSHKFLHYMDIREGIPDPSHGELMKEENSSSIPVNKMTGMLTFKKGYSMSIIYCIY